MKYSIRQYVTGDDSPAEDRDSSGSQAVAAVDRQGSVVVAAVGIVVVVGTVVVVDVAYHIHHNYHNHHHIHKVGMDYSLWALVLHNMEMVGLGRVNWLADQQQAVEELGLLLQGMSVQFLAEALSLVQME